MVALVATGFGQESPVIHVVGLHPEDRLDPLIAAGRIHVDGPVHDAVVGQAKRRHVELGRARCHLTDVARPIEHRMLAVDVKVGHLSLSGSSPCHEAMMAIPADETGRTTVARPRSVRSLGGVGRAACGCPLRSASKPMGKIIFLRHGQAEDDDGAGDAARPLTAKGVDQAELAGRALARLDLVPDLCLTSPRVRAAETARLTCAELGLTPVVESALGGGDFQAEVLAGDIGTVLLVGHEPTFSGEIARLTGGSVRMRKGGLAVVAGMRLELLAGPDLLRLAASS